MRAQRLNAQEREKLRRQRSETRLVVARCNDLGGHIQILSVTNMSGPPSCRFRVCGQSASLADGRFSQENPQGLEWHFLSG